MSAPSSRPGAAADLTLDLTLEREALVPPPSAAVPLEASSAREGSPGKPDAIRDARDARRDARVDAERARALHSAEPPPHPPPPSSLAAALAECDRLRASLSATRDALEATRRDARVDATRLHAALDALELARRDDQRAARADLDRERDARRAAESALASTRADLDRERGARREDARVHAAQIRDVAIVAATSGRRDAERAARNAAMVSGTHARGGARATNPRPATARRAGLIMGASEARGAGEPPSAAATSERGRATPRAPSEPEAETEEAETEEAREDHPPAPHRSPAPPSAAPPETTAVPAAAEPAAAEPVEAVFRDRLRRVADALARENEHLRRELHRNRRPNTARPSGGYSSSSTHAPSSFVTPARRALSTTWHGEVGRAVGRSPVAMRSRDAALGRSQTAAYSRTSSQARRPGTAVGGGMVGTSVGTPGGEFASAALRARPRTAEVRAMIDATKANIERMSLATTSPIKPTPRPRPSERSGSGSGSGGRANRIRIRG